jgi:hypothetical protein
MSRRLKVLSLIVTLLSICGCKQSEDTPSSSAGRRSGSTPPPPAKPYVNLIMGTVKYQQAAPHMVKGKKVRFRGYISIPGCKENKVTIDSGELYSGDEPAIQARELTREFMKDPTRAKKKYTDENGSGVEVIVEGVIVSEITPTGHTVYLAGHEG